MTATRQEGRGGLGELLRLALPLILSNSFWTIQVTVDRILLGRYDPEAVAAALPAAMLFWTPFILLQFTANYATTFVAQYVGAGRRERVGPAVWQAVYFSALTGLAFLGLVPAAGPLVALAGHAPSVQALEKTYLVCLCYAALPMLVTAAASSFFAGRGASWTVLVINAVGTVVNGVLDYAWIFGAWGFPAWGIAGAGWATVAGSWASAFLAVGLMLRHEYRAEYATLSGWRPDPALFGRLLRFGLPSGLHLMFDVLAFTLFVMLIGRLGSAELAATNIAFTINMVAFMPCVGLAQAIGILVGQRLGEDRPDLAARSTWTGTAAGSAYMLVVAALYALAPELFLAWFANDGDAALWTRVAALVPDLLLFVAVYSLFDGFNLFFSHALKGAGDTRYVTLMALVLSWPVMVLPTWAAWYYGWGLYWAWAAASVYITLLALVFLGRFLGGKWKSMRVIEEAPERGEGGQALHPEGIRDQRALVAGRAGDRA